MRVRPVLSSLLLVAAVLAAGCTGSNRLRYDTPKEAYEKGLALYEAGKYDRAAEYFQGTFDFGRTHEWAADAQLYLARSYARNEEYILAANEYTRFIQIFRNDPRAATAEYERAMTYYERSPAYQLDQTDTRYAIDNFRLFISRYPTNERVPDAEEKIIELRNKLARKQYEAAQLYELRDYWEAAAVTYEGVFDQFFDTKWADDALVGAMRAYVNFAEQSVATRQRERLEQAVANYERLIQVFPNSSLLKEAEAIYTDVQRRLEALDTASL